MSFRSLSAEQIMEGAKKAGLDVIEWGSDVHAPWGDQDRLLEIVKLQEESGIKCCSYGTYFRIGVTPVAELDGYIHAAKTLGTNILRLWCGNKNSEEYTEEEKTAFFAQCKAVADIAQQQGVVLCMECHNGTYTNAKEAALELMYAVNSDHFRMYWQPNQHRTDEENLAYAKALSKFTENLHVFNWRGSEKFPLCGATKLWKEYLSCFDGDRALLLEFMPDGKIETLAREADALREIVK